MLAIVAGLFAVGFGLGGLLYSLGHAPEGYENGDESHRR
jgi:hypothetical protein